MPKNSNGKSVGKQLVDITSPSRVSANGQTDAALIGAKLKQLSGILQETFDSFLDVKRESILEDTEAEVVLRLEPVHQELRALAARLEQTKTNCERLEQRIGKKLSDHSAVVGQIDGVQSEVHQLGSSVESQGCRLDSLKRDHVALREGVDASSRLAGSCMEQVSDVRVRLETSVHELSKAVGDATAKSDSLQAACDRLTRDAVRLNTRLAELERPFHQRIARLTAQIFTATERFFRNSRGRKKELQKSDMPARHPCRAAD